MTKKKKYLLALIFALLMYNFLWVLDPILGLSYDILTQQESVKEFSTDSFTLIKWTDLPDDEKNKFLNVKCSDFEYQNSTFIKVEWFSRYKNFIGNTKIYKLLTPDRLIRNRIRIPNLGKTQYLLIDPKVIDVYQKLIAELSVNELNPNEITITSGFRNPNYNEMVSGATCSQHQIGAAIDISIGDVNNDGVANKIDRTLIYEILETKLIKNKGGIGKYKNSPKLIHFDTRGHRARW